MDNIMAFLLGTLFASFAISIWSYIKTAKEIGTYNFLEVWNVRNLKESEYLFLKSEIDKLRKGQKKGNQNGTKKKNT